MEGGQAAADISEDLSVKGCPGGAVGHDFESQFDPGQLVVNLPCAQGHL